MAGNEAFRKYMDGSEFDRIKLFTVIPELLDYAAGYGDSPAVAWAGGGRSFGELMGDIAAARGAVRATGAPDGARIGLLMPNEYDLVRLFFGITTLGMTAVPFMLSPDGAGTAALINKTELYALVYCKRMEPLVNAIRPACPGVLFIGQEELDYSAAAPVSPAVTPDTPAAILFTGGTTGRPKGAVLTHRALLRGAYNGCFGYRGVFSQRYYALIPFAHVFGLVRTLLTGVQTGSLVFLCADMKLFMRELPAAQPTAMALVPGLAELLFSIGSAYGWNAVGGRLKTIIAGGAPVPPSLIAKYASAGITVLPGYGLTETANLVSGDPEPEAYPGSVGLVYDGQELKLVDGELWIRGDNVAGGYCNEPGETAAAYEDGWFKTGDLAAFDGGRLYITGRIKNLIILANGENVSPEELEEKLYALPYVKDCLVFEDRSAVGTPVIAVEVLPNAPVCEKLGIADVESRVRADVAAINASLPSYKQIHKVIIRKEDFERNQTMKVLRKNDA